jgi:tetratricopeptide (TPR) repeat protein
MILAMSAIRDSSPAAGDQPAGYAPRALETALLGTILIFSTLSVPSLASPRPWPEEPDPLAPVLHRMYNLEYAEAATLLDAWVKDHPDDLRALNYRAEAILDQEMLREGLFAATAYSHDGEALQPRKTPLPAGFEAKLSAALDAAAKAADDRLKRNPSDPEGLYWAGVIYGTRAEFDFALKRSNLAALHEGMEARREHLRLHKVQPENADALFVIGVADYVAGSLPWYVKVLASVGGFRGSRTRGLDELQRAARDGRYSATDSKIVLVLFEEREKMFAQALALLDELGHAYPGDFLVPLEKARIYKLQDNWQAATQVYDALVTSLDKDAPGGPQLPAAVILYRAGEAHEHLGESEKALALYERAAALPSSLLLSDRAKLAAGDLYLHLHREADARRAYEGLTRRSPNSPEGKAARRALQGMAEKTRD